MQKAELIILKINVMGGYESFYGYENTQNLFRTLLVWFEYLECTWTCLSDYCISCYCNKTEIITYKHGTKSWTQKEDMFYF